MKYYITLLLACIIPFTSCQSRKEASDEHQHHEAATDQPAADTVKKSLPKEEHAMVGSAHITILYTAPIVRGRIIWGGLVPYDEVWVTGAHKATSFEINKSFSVGGKTIPAGKYALFTIPGRAKWTLILNKNWEQHLADDYSEADDVARVDIVPTITEENQERLKYTVVKKSNKEGSIDIAWEKIRITVPFTID